MVNAVDDCVVLLQIADAGYYKCQALNLYGQAEVGYHLEIQSKSRHV